MALLKLQILKGTKFIYQKIVNSKFNNLSNLIVRCNTVNDNHNTRINNYIVRIFFDNI